MNNRNAPAYLITYARWDDDAYEIGEAFETGTVGTYTADQLRYALADLTSNEHPFEYPRVIHTSPQCIEVEMPDDDGVTEYRTLHFIPRPVTSSTARRLARLIDSGRISI